ncbi:DUF6879 family protein [Nocardia macrotermitis]|uniref:DUF6879 domain-containing protein n=1 Tax=Nocardia macrotermitis TaxID=2585198 RepID=A0A7K0D0W1_9NOCA|nr:DUF6879 family protein [Nocardia macrotermitis]MQY19347.1 hypothetical protein [Nocardia macrotermitis]
MLLHHGEDANRLFRENWTVAVHLELQDTYTTPEEDEPLRRFLAGESDDYAWWYDGWGAAVREMTRQGKTIRRMRVVTEPHTDYTRFALAIARLNAAAGEDIRYIPRHTVAEEALGRDDWWIFDDGLVAFSVFTPGGAGAGLATTTDPAIVSHLGDIRDRVWACGIPYAEYAAGDGGR